MTGEIQPEDVFHKGIGIVFFRNNNSKNAYRMNSVISWRMRFGAWSRIRSDVRKAF